MADEIINEWIQICDEYAKYTEEEPESGQIMYDLCDNIHKHMPIDSSLAAGAAKDDKIKWFLNCDPHVKKIL